LTEQGHEAVKQ